MVNIKHLISFFLPFVVLTLFKGTISHHIENGIYGRVVTIFRSQNFPYKTFLRSSLLNLNVETKNINAEFGILNGNENVPLVYILYAQYSDIRNSTYRYKLNLTILIYDENRYLQVYRLILHPLRHRKS